MITPNNLTITRVILAVVISLLLIKTENLSVKIFCLALFVLASVTDWLDGKLARKRAMITDFGKIADPIADKILVLGILFVFCYRQLFSVWWVVPIALREILVTVTRFICMRRGVVIQAESSGKVKTTFQIITIISAFIFFMLISSHGYTAFRKFVQWFLLISLVATNVITIATGVSFYQRLAAAKGKA